jgi:hypothetical protein
MGEDFGIGHPEGLTKSSVSFTSNLRKLPNSKVLEAIVEFFRFPFHNQFQLGTSDNARRCWPVSTHIPQNSRWGDRTLGGGSVVDVFTTQA